MLKRSILMLWGTALTLVFCAFGRDTNYSGELFSPSVGVKFYELGYELANKPAADSSAQTAQAQQALILLTATARLDNQAEYVLAEMMKLATHSESPLLLALSAERPLPADINDANAVPAPPSDNSELLRGLLKNYVKSSADLQIAKEAINYLLSRADSREQKEQQLAGLIGTFKNKNALLESDLLTSLGTLTLERADVNTAMTLFITAIDKNKYNRTAFAKLYELAPAQIPPSINLEHLRYMLGENPLDIETAVAFANYAGRLQLFELATNAYEYCASLYEYLYPAQPLPRYIYMGWALNACSTERYPNKSLWLAEKMEKSGTFDLILQAVAAKAAIKTGQTERAGRILKSAEYKALSEYQTAGADRQRLAEQLAWFYCFAKPQEAEAIDWANKAYSNDPNNPGAAALLAYAFMMNEKIEWAEPFLENYQPSAILDLTRAKIALTKDDKETAVETLKSVIESAPASLEARQARVILKSAGIEYVPAIDPGLIATAFEGAFGSAVVPTFREPNSLMKIQLNIRGDKFSYGSEFSASLVITNLSPEPLVISDYGLFRGNIRIDALLSGDIQTSVSNLVSKKILPSSPIGSKSSLIIPLRLMTGKLRDILTKHPQAALEIEFAVYLDPVQLNDGSIANRLEDVEVVTAKVQRPRIELTAQFLRNRMNTLKRRRQSYQTAELFAGLLVEQQIMAGSEPLYPFMYADWMPEILKSSLVHNLTSDHWDGRIHTMAALLPLSLDFELLEAVSENLNSEYWPLRLMTVYLLAQNQNSGFRQVLNYTAKYDADNLVRDMAVALGGKAPVE